VISCCGDFDIVFLIPDWPGCIQGQNMPSKSSHPNDLRGNTKAGAFRQSGARIVKILVVVLVVLNVVLLYAIFLSPRGLRAYRAQQADVQRLSATRTQLAQENQRLVKKIRNLKDNPGAQERLVKKELGWVRDDEIIIEFASTQNP
jgi:cell division protein FtsB